MDYIASSLIEIECYDINESDFRAVDRLHGLLGMDMKEWGKYYSGGKRSTPTSQKNRTEHRSRVARKGHEIAVALPQSLSKQFPPVLYKP